MKHVCAWCQRELSPAAAEAGPVSHGICPGCAERFLSRTPIPLELYLDDLPVPVMMMDGDATIGFANRQAQILLDLAADRFSGRKGGDVFLCAYAKQHEGCGRSLHCSGCTIRTCVERTHRTGEPQVMVPATLTTVERGEPAPVALTITTVKRGDAVLLLVNGCDEMEAQVQAD